MPAELHGAMTDARPMGLQQQQAARALPQRNVSHEDDAHALTTEGEEIHRHCWMGRCMQLQPTLQRISDGPVLHLAASD